MALAKLGINAFRLSGFYNGYWNHWRGPIFDYAEERGIHVLPTHYYSPIPSQEDLSRKAANRLRGLKIDVREGAATANALLQKYVSGIQSLITSSDYKPTNAGFGPLDAAILYASIREAQPGRIIEIGSGMSTFVMVAAIRDGNLVTNLTCIEPFLPPYLRDNNEFISQIIEQPLQDVALSMFETLDAGDILFIDSTHVARYGSDVVYEILEILPILKPGVIVHVHDIFLPDDYPESWLKKQRFFWNEQYLLQAFLCMNPHFKIEIPVHAIQRMVLPIASQDNNDAAIPASFWMRRI